MLAVPSSCTSTPAYSLVPPPAVISTYIDTPMPSRLRSPRARRTDLPRAGHQQVRVQRAAVVEADEEVLAVGIGADHRCTGEVHADQPRVSGHTTNAAFTDEAPADFVGQSPDRVALRHRRTRSDAFGGVETGLVDSLVGLRTAGQPGKDRRRFDPWIGQRARFGI